MHRLLCFKPPQMIESRRASIESFIPRDVKEGDDMSTQFITDADGNRTAVILDLETYHELLAAQEELEDIAAYDESKAAGSDAIPFDQALAEIAAERAQKRAS